MPFCFDDFFRHASSEIDVDAIRREWLALRPPYDVADRHLPLPVWARRPFTDTGEQAWAALCSQVPAGDPTGPFCIYVHVPFCRQRCPFCDCYSFRLRSHAAQHASRYVDLLEREIGIWSRLGTLASRPVSTVHLGGGTPLFLTPELFERVIRLLRVHLPGSAATVTEWALESTVAALTPERLDQLDEMGFTRLHLGVQSLQPAVRLAAGRQAPPEVVIERIETAAARGWVVTVDLIYGLPGQTLDGLLADMRALAAAGVDGFSLYELQISSRNRAFARQHGLESRPRLAGYLTAQAAGRYLVTLGFRRTLFNHFAGQHDTNLYFTFPERGEDCLALGTIADGLFGDYHYRHPAYAPYRRSVSASFPGLEGGLRRNAVENAIQPLTTALLAGRVAPSLLDGAPLRGLLERWCRSALLAPDERTGDLLLTGSGSWFAGNMITELQAAAAQFITSVDG